MRIFGDIHGNTGKYMDQAKQSPDGKSVQIGDFGIGFFQSQQWYEAVNRFFEDTNHCFIRGNHDDPDLCKKIKGFIPDGLVKDEMMFVGGAWSIDHMWRTQGIDWWENEELSYNEFNTLIDVYSFIRPKIMFTHDAPLDITFDMFIDKGLGMGGKNAKQIVTRTGEALQAMFENHQPEFWFFGHWHHTKVMKKGKTTFVCIGENDYVDFDLNKSILELRDDR